MKIPQLLFYALLAMAGSLLVSISAEATLRIAYPADSVTVNQAVISIVGTCEGGDFIRVEIRGGVSLSGEQVPVRFGGFGFQVRLNSGTALITLRSSTGETQSLHLSYGKQAAGFREWHVHRLQERFAQCSDCHRVNAERHDYKRMAMGTESCRSGNCHGEVGKEGKFVHGPAAGGVCISCHNPHGSTNAGSITRAGAEQCYICHENKRAEFEQAHQHTPVGKGDCVGCHDPHQSDYRYQLRGEGQQLCFRCHEQGDKIGGNFVHGPVAAGDCDACHSPHASPYSFQLMAEGNEVCFACHEEKRSEVDKRFVHAPMKQNCTNCHDAHSAPSKAQLAADPPQLCWKCHEKLGAEVTTATVKHPPVSEGQCGACHESHGADQARLLKQEMTRVCSACHADMVASLNAAPSKHGPVKDSDCAACHALHGGKNPTLLVKYFPPEFYNPYSEGLYALCFQCHNADIARDAETTTLTNFRNGSKNLHYLHINKRKGRSCKACHAPHASDQPKHIRRSVPFGEMYEYPIQFIKTEEGGQCFVGCHKPQTYSRKAQIK